MKRDVNVRTQLFECVNFVKDMKRSQGESAQGLLSTET